jgi:hypothetical protein
MHLFSLCQHARQSDTITHYIFAFMAYNSQFRFSLDENEILYVAALQRQTDVFLRLFNAI